MAELQDLFVSYTPIETPKENSSLSQSALDLRRSVRSRAQQIIDSQNQATEEPEEEPSVADDADLTSQPEEFKWFTEQLRTAWKQAASPEISEPMEDTTAFRLTGTVTKYSRGKLDEELKELFNKAGINVRVTSGARKAGAVGKAGSRSYHVGGNACDIVPGQGETFESIRKKMKEHPEILQFFYENGLGVIDETIPANMAKTGATGPHFHIGPDQWALKTWGEWTGNQTAGSTDKKSEWAKNTYNAFVKGLKDEYGSKYTDDRYKKVAAYMTYQAALESGYGQKANGFNYSGHMRNGKTIHYSTMDEFVKAHINTLKKWDIMNSNSLRDYVNSLYVGQYKYNPSQTPGEYYAVINGTTSKVNGYLGLNAKFGGKFSNLRELYEKSFS